MRWSYGIFTFCYVFPFFNFMSKRVRNRVQTPHFEWRTRTHLPFGVLKSGCVFLGSKIGVATTFRKTASLKTLLLKAVSPKWSGCYSPKHSLKCGWFLISLYMLEAMTGEVLTSTVLLIVRDATPELAINQYLSRKFPS